MRYIIIYAVLILLTAYVEIMYDGFYGAYFIAFELLMLAAMFLISRYLKKKIRAGLSVRIPVAGKGERINVRLWIRNRGFLPSAKMHLVVEARSAWEKKGARIPLAAGVSAKGEGEVFCTAQTEYCGRYFFKVARARVSDYLGIFSWKIADCEEVCVNVLPGFYRMEVAVSEKTRAFAVDSEEYDPHRSGDDPSEIFQVREFRDGDTLQRVHWKLSAKEGELMTKELGRPVGCSVLLLVNFQMEKGEGERLSRMDAFYELAGAVAFSMQQAGVPYVAAWFDRAEERMRRMSIRSEEQVYELADRLLGAAPYEEEIALRAAYREEYPGETFACILEVDTKASVTVNGQEALELAPGAVEEQITGFLLEV